MVNDGNDHGCTRQNSVQVCTIIVLDIPLACSIELPPHGVASAPVERRSGFLRLTRNVKVKLGRFHEEQCHRIVMMFRANLSTTAAAQGRSTGRH